ncbi:MAG: hypothetical protein ABW252_14910 [Polyangiales bacterium]
MATITSSIRFEITAPRRLAALTGMLLVAAGCAGADDAASSDVDTTEQAPLAQESTAQVDGWDPSKCDEVYRIQASDPKDPTKPFAIPPGGELHTNLRIDPPWGDEQVQAIAFKPYTENAKVLHHWILNARGAFLAGWAPGDDERPALPKDVGIELPVGKGTLGLNLHYYNTAGQVTEFDRSGVDVCVLKKDNRRPKLAAVAGLAAIGDRGVLAPAGAKDRPVTATCKLAGTEPVHIITAGPHAHTYATHMKFTATRANGEVIVMHDAPFRFGEQGTYPVPGGEVVLNAGDTITTQCFYSNPTTKNITFGESTDEEMCFNFASYYPKGSLKCAGGLFGGLGGAAAPATPTAPDIH